MAFVRFFVVLRPTGEFFPRMETTLLSVKGFEYTRHTFSCHTYGDTDTNHVMNREIQ